MVIENPSSQGILNNKANTLIDCVITATDFKIFLVQVFFKIGLIGLKLEPHESAIWAEDYGRIISSAEITDNISVVVHPIYHRALGIKVHI